MIQAHPLCWPVGYNRKALRIASKFKAKSMDVQNLLRNEIKLLGGKNLIVSSNVAVRNDGLIYSDMSESKLADPGVAIYFKWKEKDVCLCADQYLTPIENLNALAKTIEAIRGIERWGVSDFLDHAFNGFKALPFEATPAKIVEWYDVLKVDINASNEEIKAAWKKRCMETHPDKGGSPEMFALVQNAYEQAKKTRNFN